MRQKLATNQINRKRKRLKEQRQRRFRFATLGVLTILAFVFIVRPYLARDNKASADSASLLSEDLINKREYASTGARPQVEEPVQHTKVAEEKDDGFSDVHKSYKVAKNDSTIYKEKSSEGKAALKVNTGEYLRYYGAEGAWAKVSHKNIFGYIKRSDITSTNDNTLTVKNGVLYVDKDNTIPADFVTTFDVETENSLLVALEAMRREGLEVSVGRKYTSFEEEKNYITNEGKYSDPDEYTSELRTGFAVELHSLKMDPRLEDNFFDTKAGEWVKNNMYKYGFVLRYPEGKEEVTGFKANQHIFRYVGVEHAKVMFENNQTMEEYFK